MILYHFTSKGLAKKIEQEGITLGGLYIPYQDQDIVYKGFIWLTDDPRFNAQHWATNYTGLVGDRVGGRFTVNLPDAAFPWNYAALHIFQLSRDYLTAFNLAGGSDGEHWYLWHGKIPREWIVERMERSTTKEMLNA